MSTYFLDTNVLLRALLNDNLSQAQQGQQFLERARRGEVTLVLISAVVLEFEYVLRKVYGVPHEKRKEYLVSLIGTPYIEVRDRDLLRLALNLYTRSSFDLVDLLLFVSAQHEDAEVLSFDKDFRTLAANHTQVPPPRKGEV